METLFIVLFAWAEASVGMKILAVLAVIAFFLLFAIIPSESWNPISRKFEDTFDWGCGTKIVVAIICIAIILVFLQLDGNFVFWKP